MTEKQSAGFSPREVTQNSASLSARLIADNYRKILNKPLYKADNNEIGNAAAKLLEEFTLQADQDAQRLINKGQEMINGSAVTIKPQKNRLDTLSYIVLQGHEARDRSARAARAASVRWHKDEIEPTSGMFTDGFLAKIKETNPHLYEVLATYQARSAQKEKPNIPNPWERFRTQPPTEPEKKPLRFSRWVPRAAAAAVVLAFSTYAYHRFNQTDETYAAGQVSDTKPAITISYTPPQETPTAQKENKGTEKAGGPWRTTPETQTRPGDINGNVPGSPGKACNEHVSDTGLTHKNNGEPDCIPATPTPTEVPPTPTQPPTSPTPIPTEAPPTPTSTIPTEVTPTATTPPGATPTNIPPSGVTPTTPARGETPTTQPTPTKAEGSPTSTRTPKVVIVSPTPPTLPPVTRLPRAGDQPLNETTEKIAETDEFAKTTGILGSLMTAGGLIWQFSRRKSLNSR